LRKRQNTFLKLAYWKLWLVNGLGKDIYDKKSSHAIRMGHSRLRHHQVCMYAGVGVRVWE